MTDSMHFHDNNYTIGSSKINSHIGLNAPNLVASEVFGTVFDAWDGSEASHMCPRGVSTRPGPDGASLSSLGQVWGIGSAKLGDLPYKMASREASFVLTSMLAMSGGGRATA